MDLQKDYSLYTTFIKMCEVKNYSKVAVMLNYNSMQTIKEKMTTLARQVGVKTLFNGHTRGAEPTSEALELYKRVKPLIEALDFAEKDFREFNKDSEALIRMIIPATLVGSYLCDFFKKFNRKYPKVKIEFYNRAQQENYNLAMLGNVDLVIDLENACKNCGLKIFELLSLELIFIASKDFLKEKGLNEKINMKDLLELPIITRQETLMMVNRVTGFNIKPFLTTATLEPIYPLVKNGVGIGIHSKEYCEREKINDGVVNLTVEGMESLPKLKIVYGYGTNGLTKAARVFINELATFCSKN